MICKIKVVMVGYVPGPCWNMAGGKTGLGTWLARDRGGLGRWPGPG